MVQLIRRRLKESGINANSSWRALREIMNTQCRVTASFRCADGKALHVRKATLELTVFAGKHLFSVRGDEALIK